MCVRIVVETKIALYNEVITTARSRMVLYGSMDLRNLTKRERREEPLDSDHFKWYCLPSPTLTKQLRINASGCLVKVKVMPDNFGGKPEPPFRVVASLINHEAVSPRRESPVIDICIEGSVPDCSSSVTCVSLTPNAAANPKPWTPASTPNFCSLRVVNLACISRSRQSTIGSGDWTSLTSPFGTVTWMLISDTRLLNARHLSVTLRRVGVLVLNCLTSNL